MGRGSIILVGWCSLGSLLDEVKIALSRIEESDRLALTHSDIPLLLPSQRLWFDVNPGRLLSCSQRES